ncbi:hypothetical protein CICLE_v10023312mg, partial [Citrus x clementina]
MVFQIMNKSPTKFGSTDKGVLLSGLTEFAPQFESQGSRLCWENLCLSVRTEISSLSCGTGLKMQFGGPNVEDGEDLYFSL